MIYFNQALFMHESGKECLQLLEACHQTDLHNIAENGAKTVNIIVNKDACDSCKKNANKSMSIEDALKNHLLPHKECNFKLNDKAPSGWCRCYYEPGLTDLDSISVWD